eukprot:scaffold31352_cov68-Phaeocystis_antarctica.AAC.5
MPAWMWQNLLSPPALAVEEERLVRVEAKAALVARHRAAIDEVLQRRSTRLAAQLGALARHPGTVQARGVGAARDVREADRVVPVACVGLVEGVRGARSERQLWVDAGAAGHLIAAPLRDVRVPLEGEGGGGRRASRTRREGGCENAVGGLTLSPRLSLHRVIAPLFAMAASGASDFPFGVVVHTCSSAAG